MTRYDILCGRAALKPALFTRAVRAVVTDFSPPNKPLQLSVDSLPVAFVEFHPPVVVGHVHMNKYLGAEIAVEKVPNLPTKGMPQIFWDNLWFQDDDACNIQDATNNFEHTEVLEEYFECMCD